MAMRIAAILFVWIFASVAWLVLYGTLGFRTDQTMSEGAAQLGSLWGPSQAQSAPRVTSITGALSHPIELDASLIRVALALDQRRKGLLWYSLYRVKFLGTYRVINSTSGRTVALKFHLPADEAIYDDLRVAIDGRPARYSIESGDVAAAFALARGRSARVTIAYVSRGSGTWSYEFGSATSAIRNFDLLMTTNFSAIDFPPNTLSPTNERQSADGWELEWRYRNLVAGSGIGMAFPERLQPGPLAQRITLRAPLSLAFYFFVIFILTTIRRIALHPVNYFFLAAAFFAFHLLFAYTVDRISIGAAFATCSLVSMFLTISYLRLVVGLRFAAVEAALAQFFYLVLFSLALFNEGFSGLAITIGSIITLYVTMQLTGRVDWDTQLAARVTK